MTDVHAAHGTDDIQENQIDLHSSLFSSLNLNDFTIEDIEEVIRKDKAGPGGGGEGGSGVGSGFQPELPRSVPAGQTVNSFSMDGMAESSRRGPYTKILIQPAQKALRFRYECEGRSAGSIPGANSTPENKTYPTIQVMNYVGRAVVVVSCVTKDPPYRPHPHKLVGKEGCKKGICTVTINNENMICSFSNLGIQCVKRKDIEDALREREDVKVDPFKTSFVHKGQSGNIDLNSVRLCFQVFIEGDQRGKFTFPLQPVVSDPIYDKKAMCDLVICKLSACSASVMGGVEIILLCEKIVRDDVQVRFYEQKNGHIVWEGFGDFQPSDVHKQVAISLKTPKYSNTDIQEPVDVYIQLRRPSDGTSSDPRAFQFLPLDSDQDSVERKRRKIASAALGFYLAENTATTRPMLGNPIGRSQMMASRPIRQVHKPRIKTEPPDVGYTSVHPNPYAMPLHHHLPHVHHIPHMESGNLPTSAPQGAIRRPVHFLGQAPSPMDTTSVTAPLPGYAMGAPPGVPITSTSGPSLLQLHAVRMPSDMALPLGLGGPVHYPTSTPEVITLYSNSSGGSASVVPTSHAEQADSQQVMSSGSTHLSLGLGSLGSLSLSEMSLGMIGEHLSDTLQYLNADSLDGNLSGGMASQHPDDNLRCDQALGGGVEGRGGCGGAGVLQMDQQGQQSREPSMNSFSCVQDEIRVLNQLGALGGMEIPESP